jgi:hypothetical protein
MLAETMLSTADNPYNPFTEFDQWNNWDQQSGYHTLAYQARICLFSDELSELDQAQAIDMAIDEIIEHNITGNYVRVANPSSN